MGHDKLRKFAENETFSCLLQPSAGDILDHTATVPGLHLKPHPVRGHWNERMFDAPRPVVLELGCGKGDYTIALAERHPERNYIGVDIKGARLWKGAKYATEHRLPNVAFLRTRVEFITAFFAPGEVSEVWLTFSDPQYRSENSRLCSPLFLERYRSFLRPGGVVHLKTDSRFLHEYARAVCAVNGLRVLACTTDLYNMAGCEPAGPASQQPAIPSEVKEVQTFYERLFLEQGYPITYLSFVIDHDGPYVSPRDPEDFDTEAWRAAEGPRLLFGHDSAETRRQKLKNR